MVGIIYENKCVMFEPKNLDVDECVKFLEANYKSVEKGLVPFEVIKKVVDAYKHEKGIPTETDESTYEF